ncbi:DUF2169 family type VI secretion system accessory protein [Pseudoduganella sp. HUAS MS19]
MQITSNTTPFLAEPFAYTGKGGIKRFVVVVKATFDVGLDSECKPAAAQVPFVYCDQHYGEPGSSSLRHECDFAPVKLRADVLLHAQAIVPGHRALSELVVALSGPGFMKEALVTGDRCWQRGILGISPSAPQLFTSLPLVWDRAFGGADLSNEQVTENGCELRNPAGVGFHLNSDPSTILGKALPNIELPGKPMRFWFDKPSPIGFAPVGRNWRPRIGFAGTYDQAWMETTRPFLPKDFDDQYFQSAPQDQQLPTLWPGAAFACRNMSEEGLFAVRLPSFEVPVRFYFDDRTEALALKADTLILEPAARRVILLGRAGVVLPRKVLALREIQLGVQRRSTLAWKPHYRNLADAVAALRKGI